MLTIQHHRVHQELGSLTAARQIGICIKGDSAGILLMYHSSTYAHMVKVNPFSGMICGVRACQVNDIMNMGADIYVFERD